MNKPALIVVVILLIGGGALVTLGKVDRKTDLSAVMEMWGDVLRDADQTALKVTRVPDEKEMWFGQEIRDRMPPDDPAWTPYVDAVGQAVARNVRRPGIHYRFHVIEGPVVNAFAVPGGQIFVYTGMMQFLKSEAELAVILGHEISHVDLRHSIERYQYELAARKVGLDGVGQLADLAHLPIRIGYQKYQELEADQQGARLGIQAGYDPSVAPVLFTRMQQPVNHRFATPEEEVAGTLANAAADYFRSHPQSSERSARLNQLITANLGYLRGKALYVGVLNYQQRVARSQREFPNEMRSF